MRNGYYEYYEVAAMDRDRDGKAMVRADLARRLQQMKPLDAWVRKMESESRARRAARARAEQERRESHAETLALIAAAERRLDAAESPVGRILAIDRRRAMMLYNLCH